MTAEQGNDAIAFQRKGVTQSEIAERIGVSQSAVSRFLNRYNRRLIESLEKRSVREKGKQVDRLEYLYSEIVSEWERSKGSTRTVKTTTVDGGEAGDGVARTEETVRTNTGNPALIAQARGTLQDIRSILGIDAPKAVDVTSDGKPIMQPIAVVEVNRLPKREIADL